jgi:DNA-binding beta-propeller fold protein YncE
MSVIDTGDLVVTATVHVGLAPGGVAVSPNGHRAYVASSSSDIVLVIDLG